MSTGLPVAAADPTSTTTLQKQINQLQSRIASVQSVLPANNSDAEEPIFQFQHTLRQGMSNSDVSELQDFLSPFKSIYPEQMVTGYYGIRTWRAVRRLQKKLGLKMTGVVDEKTRTALNTLIVSGNDLEGLIPLAPTVITPPVNPIPVIQNPVIPPLTTTGTVFTVPTSSTPTIPAPTSPSSTTPASHASSTPSTSTSGSSSNNSGAPAPSSASNQNPTPPPSSAPNTGSSAASTNSTSSAPNPSPAPNTPPSQPTSTPPIVQSVTGACKLGGYGNSKDYYLDKAGSNTISDLKTACTNDDFKSLLSQACGENSSYLGSENVVTRASDGSVNGSSNGNFGSGIRKCSQLSSYGSPVTAGACYLVDSSFSSSLMVYQDADTGNGYAKQNVDGTNDFSAVKSHCTSDVYTALLTKYCAAHPGATSLQESVVTFDIRGSGVTFGLPGNSPKLDTCPTATLYRSRRSYLAAVLQNLKNTLLQLTTSLSHGSNKDLVATE